MGSIVVKGKLPTLALPSVTALKNVDFPTEGLPTQPITSVCPDMVASERERRSPACQGQEVRRPTREFAATAEAQADRE